MKNCCKRAVAKHLKKADFDCECAETTNGIHAYLLKQFSMPDFVVLDMRLPDGNGLDFNC